MKKIIENLKFWWALNIKNMKYRPWFMLPLIRIKQSIGWRKFRMWIIPQKKVNGHRMWMVWFVGYGLHYFVMAGIEAYYTQEPRVPVYMFTTGIWVLGFAVAGHILEVTRRMHDKLFAVYRSLTDKVIKSYSDEVRSMWTKNEEQRKLIDQYAERIKVLEAFRPEPQNAEKPKTPTA